MRIVAARNKSDIDVQFLDSHGYIKKHCLYLNFKKGQIKNPYDLTLCNVAYIGDGKYVAKEKDNTRAMYMNWNNMIRRCYDPETKKKYPAYFGEVTVCDEWLNYQNFGKWYEENKYECDDKLEIDKDILAPGNKIYSPYTCILIPKKINVLFINKTNARGLPNGIREVNDKFESIYNHDLLGTYATMGEAYEVYSKVKKQAIIEEANKYKATMPKKVYDAILNYEFDIRNDRNYTA